jgi:hypothetical protein
LANYSKIAVAAGAIEKALYLSIQPCALLAWLLEATDYFERQGRSSPYGVLWKSYPVSRMMMTARRSVRIAAWSCRFTRTARRK